MHATLALRIALITVATAGAASAQPVGLNVVLNQPLTPAILADLETRAQVLDQIPQIKAVTLRAEASQLAAIRALPYVAAAEVDAECDQAGAATPRRSTGGVDAWNLDAINVTEFGVGRTVGFDGQGIYIAVIDSGLPSNWREYFPEERIASQFARGFGGGGGTRGHVTTVPEAWQHSTDGHGTWITSILLGFRYHGPSPVLPETFDGVAPAATIIPVAVADNFSRWFSQVARAFVYLGDLKNSGALGAAPLVINMSLGGHRFDPVMAAAIDYAIASGAIVVIASGNEASNGMRFPGMYPPAISAAATGWVGQWPADDPSTFEWSLRDVPEGGIGQHFIAPFSAYELPGQDLDVAAPGLGVPVAYTRNGQPDYTFIGGASAAAPHVAGVAALMLQKNPSLTQAQIEQILESSALPLPSGCRTAIFPFITPGNPNPTFSDHRNVALMALDTCWPPAQASHGLLQADAALAATPLP